MDAKRKALQVLEAATASAATSQITSQNVRPAEAVPRTAYLPATVSWVLNRQESQQYGQFYALVSLVASVRIVFAKIGKRKN
jgi:hypothetical protein